MRYQNNVAANYLLVKYSLPLGLKGSFSPDLGDDGYNDDYNDDEYRDDY